jgi:hypothetical protein
MMQIASFLSEGRYYITMPETRIGRIYKIVCSKSNDIYIGSTFNALRTRMSQHKSNFARGKGLAAYSEFSKHEWGSLKMIQIATYEVIDRRHLEMYETLWMNKLKSANKGQACSLDKNIRVPCTCGREMYLSSFKQHKSSMYHWQHRRYRQIVPTAFFLESRDRLNFGEISYLVEDFRDPPDLRSYAI